MSFIVVSTEFFLEQLKSLNKKEKRIVWNKIKLIKLNPYRFKAIHSKKFSHVFRVKLKLHNKETRLIYVVPQPKIVIACLLERKRDYSDLEKYLRRISE